MEDPPGDAPPDDGILAAEYVIGLLTPDEARRVEARAAEDPALAQSILSWQQRLSGLARRVQPVTPPPLVWQRLEAEVMPPPAPARGEVRRRSWHHAAAWRVRQQAGLMFAGGVIGAAAMAALLASKMLIAEPAVAALVPVNAPMPAFWVMVTKDGYATVIADAAELRPGNTLELWGVPPGATTPVSLGVVPATGRVKMPAIVPAGTLLLVSSEPRGGSPTGAPTGPVVYQGRMVKG